MDLYDQILSDAEQQQPENSKRVLDVEAFSKKSKKIDQTGRVSVLTIRSCSCRNRIVYISRIPPGMGPSKLKSLLSQYGETNRVYLARDPKDTRTQRKNKTRHLSYRFEEGWVEFLDKKVARHTAELLNAKTIGGKQSSPFYHDVWTLKYLPKFKWSMLSEGIAQERAKEAALLRSEISQSKRAQSSYLDQVEKSRVQRRIKEKRELSSKAASSNADDLKEGANEDAPSQEDAHQVAQEQPVAKRKKQRAFQQRETIKSSQAQPQDDKSNKVLQGVLDNLF